MRKFFIIGLILLSVLATGCDKKENNDKNILIWYNIDIDLER